VIAVTFWSGETITAIDLPCDVVPFHWPSYTSGEGLAGPGDDPQEPAATHSATVGKNSPLGHGSSVRISS
jgi:hypothetical protein